MRHILWKGALAGGIVAFMWSIFSWTAIGWPGKVFQSFSDEDKVAQVIHENTLQSGVYLLPNPYVRGPGHCDARTANLLKNGPVVFATVQRNGVEDTMIHLVVSFVSYLLTAFLLSWAVCKTRAMLYFQKVIFITLMGGFVVSLNGILPSYLWRGFPLNYTLICMADAVIAWFLASLAMVGFLNTDNRKSK